eukprot:5049648-Amphidinium_carterae.1
MPPLPQQWQAGPGTSQARSARLRPVLFSQLSGSADPLTICAKLARLKALIKDGRLQFHDRYSLSVGRVGNT